MNNDNLLSNIKESIYNQASKISFPFNDEGTSNLLYHDLILKTLQDIGVYNPETDKVNIRDCRNGKFDITVTSQEAFEFELDIGGK